MSSTFAPYPIQFHYHAEIERKREIQRRICVSLDSNARAGKDLKQLAPLSPQSLPVVVGKGDATHARIERLRRTERSDRTA